MEEMISRTNRYSILLTLSPSVIDFNNFVDNAVIAETITLRLLDLFWVTTYVWI